MSDLQNKKKILPERAFCRELLKWYGDLLSASAQEQTDEIRNEILFYIALFILDQEKLWQGNARKILDTSLPGRQRVDISGLLPGSVRKLDLFAAGSGKNTLIPPEAGKILGDMLEHYIPLLTAMDPACEWFGRIFEELLAPPPGANREGRSSRKQTGSFYTPLPVAEYMIREALISFFTTGMEKRFSSSGKGIRSWILSSGKSPVLPAEICGYRKELLLLLKQCRILDPSCGAGVFLLAALRILCGLWHSLEPEETEGSRYSRGKFLLENVLYGMDIQKTPLEIAEFCCFLALQDSRSTAGRALPVRTHFYCTNALLQSPGSMEQFFDIVMGNPPYLPIPSIDPADRREYRRHFSFAHGRFNLFYLFLEKSRFWMKPHASSVWLVPDRVLLNTQCGEMQHFLKEKMELFHFVSFEKPLFRSASVDPVILCYRNQFPVLPEERKILCRKGVSLSSLYSAKDLRLTFYELCNASGDGPENSIRLLREKILKHSLVLGDLVRIRDGIIQGAVGRQLFRKQPLAGAPCEKLLFGRNIAPYRIRFEENYVLYDIPLMKSLEKKYAPGQAPGLRMRTPEIFQVPKILSRQTSDRIIAALDEQGEYFYANTLHGTVSVSPDHDLYFILGIMNSRLFTFFYRSQSMEQGKVFAQIKIALLKKLPVPDMEPEMRQEIACLVKKLLSVKDGKCEPYLKEISRQIDSRIYSFYDLSPEEIRLVEKNS